MNELQKNTQIPILKLIFFVITTFTVAFFILYFYDLAFNFNTLLFIILTPLIISPFFLSRDVMHPFVVFFLTSQFLFIFNMLDINSNKKSLIYSRFPSDYYDTAFTWSILIIIIWYVSMYIGYFFTKSNNKLVRTNDIKNPIFISMILIIVGIISFLYIFFLKGGIEGILNALTNRRESYSGLAYFIKLTGLITIGSLILLSKGYKKSSLLLILISFALLSLFGGRGNAFFGSVFPYLIYYHYRVKKIRFIQLLPIGLLTVIFILLLGNYRLYQEFKLNITGLYDMISKLAHNTQGGTILPSLVGSLIRGEIEYQYGSTLINIIYAPIPRSVWAEKPLIDESGIVGQLLMGSEYWGLPPGPYGIAFLNFSFIGVIVFGFITGMVVRRLYVNFVLKKNTDLSLIFYILALPYVFNIVSTSSQINIFWYIGIFIIIKFLDSFILILKNKKVILYRI